MYPNAGGQRHGSAVAAAPPPQSFLFYAPCLHDSIEDVEGEDHFTTGLPPVPTIGSRRGNASNDSIALAAQVFQRPSCESTPSFLFYAPCMSEDALDADKEWSEDDTSLPIVRVPVRHRRLTIASVGSSGSFTHTPHSLPRLPNAGPRRPLEPSPLAPLRSLRGSVPDAISTPDIPIGEGLRSPMPQCKSPHAEQSGEYALRSPTNSNCPSPILISSNAARPTPAHRRRSTIFPLRPLTFAPNTPPAISSPLDASPKHLVFSPRALNTGAL